MAMMLKSELGSQLLNSSSGQEGAYHHRREVKGTEAGVEYDKMVATVGLLWLKGW